MNYPQFDSWISFISYLIYNVLDLAIFDNNQIVINHNDNLPMHHLRWAVESFCAERKADLATCNLHNGHTFSSFKAISSNFFMKFSENTCLPWPVIMICVTYMLFPPHFLLSLFLLLLIQIVWSSVFTPYGKNDCRCNWMKLKVQKCWTLFFLINLKAKISIHWFLFHICYNFFYFLLKSPPWMHCRFVSCILFTIILIVT